MWYVVDMVAELGGMARRAGGGRSLVCFSL